MTSAIEHASVLDAAPQALRVAATVDGVTDLAALDNVLKGADLVSVMLANNETGVIQPIAEIARRARAQGAAIHCDAVQAIGRMAVDMTDLDVDYMTLSAHKIGGPMGAGALIVRDGAPDLAGQLRGGGQERGRRAGTENVPSIAGFGAAARQAADGQADIARMADLRDMLEERVTKAAPEAVIYGRGAPRLANTSLIGLAGMTSDTTVMGARSRWDRGQCGGCLFKR